MSVLPVPPAVSCGWRLGRQQLLDGRCVCLRRRRPSRCALGGRPTGAGRTPRTRFTFAQWCMGPIENAPVVLCAGRND
jgi:hypothetical protein